MNSEYDIIIAGGGLVGSCLAVALAESGARIAVIEAIPYQSESQPSFDDRGLALSQSSRKILEAIGLWSVVSGHACPIRRVHVSDRGRFGFMRLHAADLDLDALGYVVTARELGRAVIASIQTHENIELVCPATTVGVVQDTDKVAVSLDMDGAAVEYNCNLLVAADGARSRISSGLNIPVRSRDYGQTAIVANVTPEGFHEHTAYERFTSTGPVALLPLSGQHCKMVFTVESEDAGYYMDLSDMDFLEKLQERFGRRLGRFTRIGARTAYQLMLQEAEHQIRGRIVLAGNAAHTLHPHGAQGFNLSLRDIAALRHSLLPVLKEGGDPGDPVLLEAYLMDRRPDQQRIMNFSDRLADLFYNQDPLKVVARNGAMVLMDLVPVFKRQLLFLTHGVSGSPTAGSCFKRL